MLVTFQTRQVRRNVAPLVRGSFGTVYRATDLTNAEDFVVKRVICAEARRIAPLIDPTQEPLIHWNLSQHQNPHILQCYDFLQSHQRIQLLLQFASGGDFFDFIGNNGRTMSFVVHYGRQLLDGIAFCHQHSILHRDLKPENLFMINQGGGEPPLLTIGDFGMARNLQAEPTKQRLYTFCGTLEFMAPEVLCPDKTGGYSFPADMWSVGMILYAMKTSMCMFQNVPDTPDARNKYFARILCNPQYQYDLSAITDPVLQTLVASLISYDPTGRPTASQALADPIFSLCFPFNPDDFEVPEPHVDQHSLRSSSFNGF